MKIAIAGCQGRMGQSLLRVSGEFADIHVIRGISREAGKEASKKLIERFELEKEFELVDSAAKALESCDAIIDFTSPKLSLEIAALVASKNKIHVCGTTGLADPEMQQLKNHGKSARIFYAANTSVLVHLVASLVKLAAGKVPLETDIDIMEIHHHHKKDAPSGTALLLGKAAAEGRGVSLNDCQQTILPGQDSLRWEGAITLGSIRTGDVVGEHTVYLSLPGERIEITHKALNRDIFARGALRVAAWLKNQPNGFYGMGDMLGMAS